MTEPPEPTLDVRPVENPSDGPRERAEGDDPVAGLAVAIAACALLVAAYALSETRRAR